MMCYCHKECQTTWVRFEVGKYYEHLGGREMKNGEKIVGFGKLERWKEFFLEPQEDRDRKLKELI